MNADQYPYRQLVESLYDAPESDDTYSEHLLPWLQANPREVEWLRALSARTGQPIPALDVQERTRLYALSRVLQVLLLRFQPGPSPKDSWEGPRLTLAEYEAFATGLGLTVSYPERFCPFDHEITSVEQGPGAPEVLSLEWPRLMLGSLLIERAGARVRASSAHIHRDAARSKLYWAYRRRLRPVQDLSHGWGHNSQWRTAFRRDYRIDGTLWFNVDGTLDLGAEHAPQTGKPQAIWTEDQLSRSDRVALLVHRCEVGGPLTNDEPWLWDDTLCVSEANFDGVSWPLSDWPRAS